MPALEQSLPRLHIDPDSLKETCSAIAHYILSLRIPEYYGEVTWNENLQISSYICTDNSLNDKVHEYSYSLSKRVPRMTYDNFTECSEEQSIVKKSNSQLVTNLVKDNTEINKNIETSKKINFADSCLNDKYKNISIKNNDQLKTLKEKNNSNSKNNSLTDIFIDVAETPQKLAMWYDSDISEPTEIQKLPKTIIRKENQSKEHLQLTSDLSSITCNRPKSNLLYHTPGIDINKEVFDIQDSSESNSSISNVPKLYTPHDLNKANSSIESLQRLESLTNDGLHISYKKESYFHKKSILSDDIYPLSEDSVTKLTESENDFVKSNIIFEGNSNTKLSNKEDSINKFYIQRRAFVTQPNQYPDDSIFDTTLDKDLPDIVPVNIISENKTTIESSLNLIDNGMNNDILIRQQTETIPKEQLHISHRSDFNIDLFQCFSKELLDTTRAASISSGKLGALLSSIAGRGVSDELVILFEDRNILNDVELINLISWKNTLSYYVNNPKIPYTNSSSDSSSIGETEWEEIPDNSQQKSVADDDYTNDISRKSISVDSSIDWLPFKYLEESRMSTDNNKKNLPGTSRVHWHDRVSKFENSSEAACNEPVEFAPLPYRLSVDGTPFEPIRLADLPCYRSLSFIAWDSVLKKDILYNQNQTIDGEILNSENLCNSIINTEMKHLSIFQDHSDKSSEISNNEITELYSNKNDTDILLLDNHSNQYSSLINKDLLENNVSKTYEDWTKKNLDGNPYDFLDYLSTNMSTKLKSIIKSFCHLYSNDVNSIDQSIYKKKSNSLKKNTVNKNNEYISRHTNNATENIRQHKIFQILKYKILTELKYHIQIPNLYISKKSLLKYCNWLLKSNKDHSNKYLINITKKIILYEKDYISKSLNNMNVSMSNISTIKYLYWIRRNINNTFLKSYLFSQTDTSDIITNIINSNESVNQNHITQVVDKYNKNKTDKKDLNSSFSKNKLYYAASSESFCSDDMESNFSSDIENSYSNMQKKNDFNNIKKKLSRHIKNIPYNDKPINKNCYLVKKKHYNSSRYEEFTNKNIKNIISLEKLYNFNDNDIISNISNKSLLTNNSHHFNLSKNSYIKYRNQINSEGLNMIDRNIASLSTKNKQHRSKNYRYFNSLLFLNSKKTHLSKSNSVVISKNNCSRVISSNSFSIKHNIPLKLDKTLLNNTFYILDNDKNSFRNKNKLTKSYNYLHNKNQGKKYKVNINTENDQSTDKTFKLIPGHINYKYFASCDDIDEQYGSDCYLTNDINFDLESDTLQSKLDMLSDISINCKKNRYDFANISSITGVASYTDSFYREESSSSRSNITSNIYHVISPRYFNENLTDLKRIENSEILYRKKRNISKISFSNQPTILKYVNRNIPDNKLNCHNINYNKQYFKYCDESNIHNVVSNKSYLDIYSPENNSNQTCNSMPSPNISNTRCLNSPKQKRYSSFNNTCDIHSLELHAKDSNLSSTYTSKISPFEKSEGIQYNKIKVFNNTIIPYDDQYSSISLKNNNYSSNKYSINNDRNYSDHKESYNLKLKNKSKQINLMNKVKNFYSSKELNKIPSLYLKKKHTFKKNIRPNKFLKPQFSILSVINDNNGLEFYFHTFITSWNSVYRKSYITYEKQFPYRNRERVILSTSINPRRKKIILDSKIYILLKKQVEDILKPLLTKLIGTAHTQIYTNIKLLILFQKAISKAVGRKIDLNAIHLLILLRYDELRELFSRTLQSVSTAVRWKGLNKSIEYRHGIPLLFPPARYKYPGINSQFRKDLRESRSAPVLTLTIKFCIDESQAKLNLFGALSRLTIPSTSDVVEVWFIRFELGHSENIIKEVKKATKAVRYAILQNPIQKLKLRAELSLTDSRVTVWNSHVVVNSMRNLPSFLF